MASTPERRPERWANLRHSIVGTLLAAPPPRGELRAALEALATKTWTHPITGGQVRFAFSTLEAAVTLDDLRRACRMRTQTLCDALADLVGVGRVLKSDAGYRLA